MKKLYPITKSICIGICILIASSCIKDKSMNGNLIFPSVTTAGLDSSYNVYSMIDTLHINPTVKNEDEYEFYWTTYSTAINLIGGIVPKQDTIATTKLLNFPVTLNPAEYILMFNVKNRQTGVVDIIKRPLNVSSLNMNGWYLLKDNAGKTDFDYIYPNGRINNWIATYNNGKSLEGLPIKAVFSPSFKTGITSTDLFNAFAVISDQDAAIYRIDNGKKVMGFDSMFFTMPSVKKPQNIFQPKSNTELVVINNNQAYDMVKGSLFGIMGTNSYKVSAIGTVGAALLLFDENMHSIICQSGYNYSTLPSSGTLLKNMNANLKWITCYPDATRQAAYALFKQTDGTGLLFKLNSGYGYLFGYQSPIINTIDTIPANHGIITAEVIAGNHDADYIYYAKGNHIFQTNIASIPENLQLSLPEGEQVTCMQHIKYPEPDTNVSSTTDYLAVASYANGHYKVWLYTISTTGTIRSLAKPNFEGEGKVVCINYVQGTSGSRVY